MSTREIDETFKGMYGVEVNKDIITRITDKILPEILAWQSILTNDITQSYLWMISDLKLVKMVNT